MTSIVHRVLSNYRLVLIAQDDFIKRPGQLPVHPRDIPPE